MPRSRLLTRSLLLLLLCGTIAVVPAHPALALSAHHAHKQAKEQIEDMEQRWQTATLASDIPSLENLLADDYVGISWNGQVNTKTSQLNRVRTKAFAISQMQVSDTRIKLLGQTAIVTGQVNLVGVIDSAPLQGSFRYTRVYRRLTTGWRITNFEATLIPVTARAHRPLLE